MTQFSIFNFQFSKKLVNYQLSIINYKSGFTLIELIVVFSVLTILSSIGIASFVTYSRSQAVDTAMKNFKETLFTARSRALSQLRDSSCFSSGFTGQGYQLQGYQVVACCSFGSLCSQQTCTDFSDNYELQAVYAASDGSGRSTQTCTGEKFNDASLTISSANTTTATYFFFASVTGAVTTNATSGQLPQIGISGYGTTKLATVSATGVIQ